MGKKHQARLKLEMRFDHEVKASATTKKAPKLWVLLQNKTLGPAFLTLFP
jgi:hypothetical protein